MTAALKIMSRPEAIAAGATHYYTGRPCKRGHDGASRLTSSAQCTKCATELVKARRKADPEHHNSVRREYYSKNKDKMSAARRVSYLKHRDARIQYARERYPISRLVYAKWAAENRDRDREKAARRRASERLATPAWACRDEMLAVYRRSSEITRETGIQHEVDHIVPLLSDIVCGLHCPANLQIITKSENARKKNFFWPDMPAEAGAS